MFKALIVDDEIMIRNGIERVIPWESISIEKVFKAGGGKEALQIIQGEWPDIMITDINMTGMNGLELIEASRAINPEMKVFVLTGYDDFKYAQQSLRLHVVDFFLKPIDEEVLVMAIRDAVEGIKNERSSQVKQQSEFRAQGVREQLELENHMRKLIYGEEIAESLERLKKDYLYDTDRDIMVAIIEPNLNMNDPDGQYRHLFVKNVSIDLFDLQESGITFNDDDARLLIGLFINSNEDDSQEKMESLSSILMDEHGSQIKIVAGSVVHGFADISISYNDAVLLEESEKEEVKSIIQNQRIEKRQQLFEEIFTELKHYMICNIGDVDLVYKAFDTFVKAIDAYNLSVSQVRRCSFDIASELYYAYISDTGKEVEDKLVKLLVSLNMATKVIACDSTMKFITDLFDNSHLKQDDLINTAKIYIADHLGGDLSVAKLAEELFVTPNYLSRLFKKVTGIGCNEYIIMRRIQKAKAMLETTSVQTGSIAKFVGYKDTNYFSLAFKKHTGLSPTSYREKVRNNG